MSEHDLYVITSLITKDCQSYMRADTKTCLSDVCRICAE